MSVRSILRLASQLVTALGVNAVPAVAVFGRGAGGETAMLLYFLENVVAIALAVLLVWLLAPARDESSPNHRTRRSLLGTYLAVAGGFTAVNGVFIVLFLGLVLDASFPAGIVRWGIAAMLLFELVAFFSDAVTLRPLSLAGAEKVLERSLGRVALLHLGVFVGVFLAAVVETWFVLPFIVLKTIVDVGTPIEALWRRGRGESTDYADFAD